MSTCPFDTLPNEIISHIMSFIFDSRTYYRCRLICKAFDCFTNNHIRVIMNRRLNNINKLLRTQVMCINKIINTRESPQHLDSINVTNIWIHAHIINSHLDEIDKLTSSECIINI